MFPGSIAIDAASPALFIALHAGARSDAQARPPNRLTPRDAGYVTEIARRLGISDMHPHRLWHTLGTLVQEQLGDSTDRGDPGHVGLASVAGYTKITAARRAAVRGSLEDASL